MLLTGYNPFPTFSCSCRVLVRAPAAKSAWDISSIRTWQMGKGRCIICLFLCCLKAISCRGSDWYTAVAYCTLHLVTCFHWWLWYSNCMFFHCDRKGSWVLPEMAACRLVAYEQLIKWSHYYEELNTLATIYPLVVQNTPSLQQAQNGRSRNSFVFFQFCLWNWKHVWSVLFGAASDLTLPFAASTMTAFQALQFYYPRQAEKTKAKACD